MEEQEQASPRKVYGRGRSTLRSRPDTADPQTRRPEQRLPAPPGERNRQLVLHEQKAQPPSTRASSAKGCYVRRGQGEANINPSCFLSRGGKTPGGDGGADDAADAITARVRRLLSGRQQFNNNAMMAANASTTGAAVAVALAGEQRMAASRPPTTSTTVKRYAKHPPLLPNPAAVGMDAAARADAPRNPLPSDEAELRWINKLVQYTRQRPVLLHDSRSGTADFDFTTRRWEEVVFPAAAPDRHEHIVMLSHWMRDMLWEIELEHAEQEGHEDSDGLPAAKALVDSSLWVYRAAFEQLRRMVALQSTERASLLTHAWEQSLRMVELRTQLVYEESISKLHEELARGRGELKDAGDRHQQFVEGSAQATNELREEAERERQSASLMSQRLLKEQKTNAGAKDHLRDLNDQILVELKLRMQLQEDLDKGNEEALEISSRMRTAEEEVTRLGFELQSVRNANARMTHGLEFQIAQNRQLVRGKEGLEEEVQMLTEERAKLRTTRDELADKLSHMERMYNQNALKLQELKQAHEELGERYESVNHALDRAMEAKSDVEKQLAEKAHAKLAVDLMLTRAKKDIAALNSKLDGYKTIESDLKAEFAEREVRLNQQLSDAHHRLQELEVENKKVNHLMDVIEATEKLAVEELSTYRTELMKFSAFIHHPSEALEDAAWTKTFTAVERAEWVDNGFESRGQQTLQLTLTRLTELTRALEQSLSDRDSTQKQCLQEEEERRQINRKLYEEMRTSQKAIQNADRKQADATKQLQWVESLRAELVEARAALASLQILTDEKDARILQLNNDAEVHKLVERRAQRMKAQIDDAQGKLTAAEEESGRLRNELYTTTMQLEEHKKTVEMQAVELDTLGKLSYTQRVQLDDVLAKKADLEHHHSLLSMELEELQKVHANYKSQMEQKCDIYEVEAAHKAQIVADQKVALQGANLSIAVAKFFVQGLATDPQPVEQGCPSKTMMFSGQESPGAHFTPSPGPSAPKAFRSQPSPFSDVNTPQSAQSRSNVVTPKTGQTAMSDLAQQDETFEQRKMEFELGRAKNKLSNLELEYVRAKETAEEARRVLAEISGREEEQVALAAALPTRIPAPLGWRKNLALVQLGQLTETVQRMRVTLRQREQSEETLCVWVQRTLEELSVELMEEFAAERALVEQQTRQVAELRAELRETLATVTDTWKLTLPMLTRLRKLDDIKAARVDQETLVQDDAVEATIQYVVDSLPSEPLSRKLLEANNREHCMRLIVAVYTRRLETTQHFYTVSERVLSDSIYQPIYEVFRSVYPTAGRKALDGKIRDFVHAVRGFQDTEKFNTFGKFMGYDIETSHSVRHYYFFCELLDCVKRLTGIKWRHIVAEWEKGAALIPMETILDVLGNVYNSNAPRSLPVAKDYILKLSKDGKRAGPCVDLDMFLALMLKEFPHVPMYPMLRPREAPQFGKGGM